jgi:hypothetical protein
MNAVSEACACRTLEQGFEYRLYVGYDMGDIFYDK